LRSSPAPSMGWLGVARSQWLGELAKAADLDESAADGGVTVGMVYQQEAARYSKDVSALIVGWGDKRICVG
jgi:hypothetical protein